MPTKVPNELVGPVDPREPSQIQRMNDEDKRTMRQVLELLGHNKHKICTSMMHLLHSRFMIKHTGRLQLVKFLAGNGIGDTEIRMILRYRVKWHRRPDVDGILHSMKNPAWNWTYWSTRYQLWLYNNGHVSSKLTDYTRLQIADYHWEKNLNQSIKTYKPWPKLHEKIEFYSDFGLDERYCVS
jgi:hypothetical protein